MKRPRYRDAIFLSTATSAPLLILLFAGKQLAGLPFIPFDVFDALVRRLPGGVLAITLDTLLGAIRAFQLGPTATTAKLVEQILALAGWIAGVALFGVVITYVMRHGLSSGRRTGAWAGGGLFLMIVAVELSSSRPGNPALFVPWLGILLGSWGVILGRCLEPGPLPSLGAYEASRRAFLLKVAAASLVASLGETTLIRVLASLQAGEVTTSAQLPNLPMPSSPDVHRLDPVAGTRSEITSNEDFYRTDINASPIQIKEWDWRLEFDGLFDAPRPVTLAELKAYPPVTAPITLSCIANSVGGDVIGTTYWNGVRLPSLLVDLGLRAEATDLHVTSADGYFESVPKSDFTDPRTLLVYGMNGHTLPAEHGFPLRILIPNRYGMKQPKWITKIEARDHDSPGYYVERGWDKEARPEIMSTIDVIAADRAQDRRVILGGIAWAGDRGIQRVEVQIDGGLWQGAALRLPALGPLAWVQWRFEMPLGDGQHTFRVRAADGTGTLQNEAPMRAGSDPQGWWNPGGATGYHSVTSTL